MLHHLSFILAFTSQRRLERHHLSSFLSITSRHRLERQMPKMDVDDDDMPPPLINIESLQHDEPTIAPIPVVKTPEIVPQTPEEWKSKGDDSYRSKNYQKAVDSYSQAINNQIEKNASYYLNRAASYLMLGSYQEALKDCDTAISIEPNNPKPYFRKATALKSVGRFEDARKALTDGLVLDPSSTTATCELSNLNSLKIKVDNLHQKMEMKQYRILLPEIDAVIRLTGSRVRELNLLKVRVLIELNRISEAYNLTNSMMKEIGSSVDMELISVRGMYV